MSIEWTAGFLEGEGSFFLNRKKNSRPQVVVKATQIEPECLLRLQKLYGGSVVWDRRRRASARSSKPLREWRLTGAKAYSLMQALYPLMSEKRRGQIRAVMDEIGDHWFDKAEAA
jgi:hypothetical protein